MEVSVAIVMFCLVRRNGSFNKALRWSLSSYLPFSTYVPQSIYEKATALHQQIFESRKKYYLEGTSSLTDVEYDELIEKFRDLTKEYPSLEKEEEFRHTLDFGVPIQEDSQIRHARPMLSLNSIKLPSENKDDALKSIDRFFQSSATPEAQQKYVMETKFDGIAISLTFKDGLFMRAATRGNGIAGEDITTSFQRMAGNVPWLIRETRAVEIRGELTLKKVLAPQGNARNLVAGYLRGKSLERDVPSLDFFAYSLDFVEIDAGTFLPTQHDRLDYLGQLGFTIDSEYKTGTSTEILDSLETFLHRTDYPYDYDGCVIKVDDVSAHESLGATSHFPRWAVAVKPQNQSENGIGVVSDIEYSIGRLGRITPVVKLKEPVVIKSASISRIGLPHYQRLLELDLRPDDSVEIERAGSVIPVLVRKLDSCSNTPFELSKLNDGSLCCPCPERSAVRFSLKDGCNVYCNADDCQEAAIMKTAHFTSKQGLNIKGFGIAVAKTLHVKGLVNTVSDIFRLDQEQLSLLPGWKEKKIANLQTAISNAAEKCSQEDVFVAFGIPGLGKQAVRLLIQKFGDISSIISASDEELLELPGIGKESIKSLRSVSEGIIRECTKLKQNGVKCF